MGILWGCMVWNSLGMYGLEFFGNSLAFFKDSLGILRAFYQNSLGILWKFYRNSLGMCGLGVLNVWVLILGDKEVRFDLMTGQQKRSLEAWSLSAHT